MKIECLGSGSKGNCYIVTLESGDIIILEAGVPYKEIKKVLGYRLLDVKMVLITHEHGDHSKAVYDMIEDGLNIYASKGTLEALNILNLRRVHVFKDMNTSKYIIKGFKAQHNALEPLTFTIADKTTRESLVFITDSAYTDFIFNGFTYYLTESNYIAEYVEETREKGIYTNPVGHMSLENNIEMYKRTDLSNCQQIILVHISDTNGNPDRMVRELKEVTNCNVDYAKKGKVWDLKPTPF